MLVTGSHSRGSEEGRALAATGRRIANNFRNGLGDINSSNGMIYSSKKDWNKSRLLTGRCLPASGQWSIGTGLFPAIFSIRANVLLNNAL